MRIFLTICAVLAALVVGLLFAAPALIDATKYRGEVETVASRTAGQPVQINGNLSFRLLPTPRVVAEEVRIAPPPQHSDLEPLLTARRAVIVLSGSDLLSGRFTANRVIIAEPQITVHTNLAGHSNLIVERGRDVPIRNLELRNGRFQYRDESAGHVFDLSDLSGEFSTEGAFDTRTIDLAGIWAGRNGELKARVTSSDRPSVTAELSVDGLGAASFKGRLAAVDSWNVEGEAAVTIHDLSAVFPDLDLPSGDEKKLAFTARGQTEVTTQSLAMVGASGKIMEVPYGGRLEMTFGETVDLDASMSFEQLDGAELTPWIGRLADRLISGNLVLPAAPGLRARLQFDTGLVTYPGGFVRQVTASAAYNDGMLAVDRFAALLPGGSDFAFSGDVRLAGGAFRLSGSTEIGSDNLAALLEAAGAPIKPEGHGRFRNFSLSAGLLMDSSVAQVSDIDLRFDQSRVTGGVAIALVSRPSFSMNLTVDQLNANAYAGLVDFEAAGLTLIGGDPNRPSMPILDAFDTNAALRIGRLIAGGSVVRGLRLDAALLGGVLDLKLLEISDLDGGSATLSGRVDTPEDPQWLLQGQIESGNPARMFGGRVGEYLPVLARTGELTARFGLEGGLARTAAEIDLVTPSLDVRLEGLLSGLLTDLQFDLDAGLSAAEGRQALSDLFPALTLPSGVSGPLVADGQLSGRLDDLALEGKVDLLSARADLSGTLTGLGGDRPAYEMDVRLRHGDFHQLLIALDASLSPGENAPAPLDMSFSVEGDGDRSSVTALAIAAGTDAVEGELKIDWRPIRPKLDIRIDDGQIDLGNYAASRTYGARAAIVADDRAYRWSKLPLDWPWMRLADLRAEASLSGLRAFGLALSDARFDLTSDEEEWRIEGFSAFVDTGTVEADARMRTRPLPDLELSASFRDVAFPSITEAFLGRAYPAQGMVSMDLELSARGLTEHDLIRSLDGQVEIEGQTAIELPKGVSLEDVSGDIDVRYGVARAAPALNGRSGGQPATIIGSLDIGDWIADMELRFDEGGSRKVISITGPMQDLAIR